LKATVYDLSNFQYSTLFNAANISPIFYIRKSTIESAKGNRAERAVNNLEIDHLVELKLVSEITHRVFTGRYGKQMADMYARQTDGNDEPLRFFRITDIGFDMFYAVDKRDTN
jgi:hypothetical protein